MGGVLSPLMWLLLINRLPRRVKDQMERTQSGMDIRKNLPLLVFADDISMAAMGKTAMEVTEMLNCLAIILQRTLREIGATLSAEKCKNFLIQMGGSALRLFKRGDPTTK